MAKNLTFAKAIQRLEQIVEKLESEDVELEEGIKLLGEGLALHKLCEQKLKGAQAQIKKLEIGNEVKTK